MTAGRPIRFTVRARSASCHARHGAVETPHGSFETPAFMPVGTRATVKGLTPEQVRATGSQILLNNAYHLMLRPGDDLIARRGGVHRFMRWDGPILTDSGGFQAFSMSDINAVDEDGVVFRSIIDGAAVALTPERSMEVQANLGADIIMAFDDCPPGADSDDGSGANSGASSGANSGARESPAFRARRLEAHERTIRWLDRCVRAPGRRADQALFGIVQGGVDLDLRRASVDAICAHDLPGYAIGGVAVGEGPELIARVVAHTAPLLPEDRPRYLMGVGYERDIVAAVRAGVDMFDCVLPTRNGRNGHAFTPTGRLNLRNARFAEDDAPLDAACDCLACGGGFSRAYLRHLVMAGEMLAGTLVSIHNIRHFQRLLLDIREAIREDAWSLFAEGWPVTAPVEVSSGPSR